MTTPILEQLRSVCPELFDTPLFVLDRHSSDLGCGSSTAVFRTPDFRVQFLIEDGRRAVMFSRTDDVNTWWDWSWLLRVPAPPPHAWNRKHTAWSTVRTDFLGILDNFELISLLMGEAFEEITRLILERFRDENVRRSWGRDW